MIHPFQVFLQDLQRTVQISCPLFPQDTDQTVTDDRMRIIRRKRKTGIAVDVMLHAFDSLLPLFLCCSPVPSWRRKDPAVDHHENRSRTDQDQQDGCRFGKSCQHADDGPHNTADAGCQNTRCQSLPPGTDQVHTSLDPRPGDQIIAESRPLVQDLLRVFQLSLRAIGISLQNDGIKLLPFLRLFSVLRFTAGFFQRNLRVRVLQFREHGVRVIQIAETALLFLPVVIPDNQVQDRREERLSAAFAHRHSLIYMRHL